jgi:membrane-bound metal-dependent hydrolase YbcI (DUF457 family)
MFIGHFGLALAAKRIAPKTSLASLIFATEFVDLLWPVCLLLGIEHVTIVPGITRMTPLDFVDYPVTHSLLMITVWSLIVGGLYYALRRYPRGAWVMAAGVFSHWILDWVTHRPDLALYPGGSGRFGLGLWNHPLLEIPLEAGIFVLGIVIYLSTTRARDRAGVYAFWSLMALLFGGWLSAVMASPPPSVKAVAWGSLSMWLTVPWARWADRRRTVISRP